ncbi:predicted protein [Postia placenta Mad-698-R]|nr:predicted protein [Postia placenta Mad-698-R]
MACNSPSHNATVSRQRAKRRPQGLVERTFDGNKRTTNYIGFSAEFTTHHTNFLKWTVFFQYYSRNFAITRRVKTRDSHTITWDVVKRDFNSLMAEGLWEDGVEGEQLLQDIRKILMNQTRSQSRSSSVARAARSPTRSPDGTEHDSLALEKLSDPTPAVQLPRLKRLYEDLHTALQPLLPVNHPLLIVLSSPLSPTSSPLRSAITHLRETLTCLRERCAPARDAQIEKLIRRIDDLSPIAPGEDTARLVVDTIRFTLQLSEAMKDDLSQFVLGTMDEKQLRAVIVLQAQQRERELVLKLWRPEQIQESWAKWHVENAGSQNIGEHPARRMWVYRLVHALGLFTPVSCPLSTTPIPASAELTEKAPVSNMLPPSFFFVCPTLLYLQNYLQALVIAASLRSLRCINYDDSRMASAIFTLAEFSYGLSTLSASILKKHREEAAKTHQYSSAETEAPSGRQGYRCPNPKLAGRSQSHQRHCVASSAKDSDE